MILTCPSCGTQYEVKDGAIPDGGRKVRCAACGHSWHQEAAEPPEQGLKDVEESPSPERETETVPVTHPAAAPGDPAAPTARVEEAPGKPEQVGFEPTEPIPPGAELVESPTAVPVPPPEEPWPEERSDEQDWDPEKEIPDAEEIDAALHETRADRKRNWVMAVLMTVVFVVLIALAFWLLAPDSVRQQVGFSAANPTPLKIAPGTPERQTLASGNELVVVSGRVVNPSSDEQPVPPIEAQLRDGNGKLVYSWTIAPPARTLPPGGSVPFNSAEMGVPASGSGSTVTLVLKS